MAKNTSREMTDEEAENLDNEYATRDFKRILDEVCKVVDEINRGTKAQIGLHVESLVQEIVCVGLQHGAKLDDYELPSV